MADDTIFARLCTQVMAQSDSTPPGTGSRACSSARRHRGSPIPKETRPISILPQRVYKLLRKWRRPSCAPTTRNLLPDHSLINGRADCSERQEQCRAGRNRHWADDQEDIAFLTGPSELIFSSSCMCIEVQHFVGYACRCRNVCKTNLRVQ
jgi:hypothetical protein